MRYCLSLDCLPNILIMVLEMAMIMMHGAIYFFLAGRLSKWTFPEKLRAWRMRPRMLC